MYDLDLNQRLDVWVGSIHQWQGEEILLNRVTEEERKQSQKYYFEPLRTRALVSRGLLRTILSRYVSADPLELQIERGKYGKPYLANHPDIYFNISHSGDMFLCSVSLIGEIGVDVEAVVEMNDSTSIAERYFSVEEKAELEKLTTPAYLPKFFHFWTRKEAFVKAIGKGLGLDLQSFDVSTNRVSFQPSFVKSSENANWTMCSFSPSKGYAAAVCVQGELPRLCFMPLEKCLLEALPGMRA
jgi:4'-phosphopantetheinyl transferase